MREWLLRNRENLIMTVAVSGVILLLLIVIHRPHALGIGESVRVDETQRFEPVSKSDINGYQFTVFHDKVSGQEFSCVENYHLNPSCFPTGRNWK